MFLDIILIHVFRLHILTNTPQGIRNKTIISPTPLLPLTL
jgi:hypothetical protein